MNLLYRRNIMYPQQFYFFWLTKATVAAILAAFGQDDGRQVIKATNAYLNQLAASDRDKATALAGFINEGHPYDALISMYNQDGLVFQMDRAYGLSAAKWTDLIGDTEFVGTNVQIIDDMPYFNGSAYYTGDESYHDPANTTIEVVFYNEVSSGWKALYFENSQSNAREKRALGFSRDNGEYIAFGCGTANFNNPIFTIPLNDLVRVSISGKNTVAVQNGVTATSSRPDYFGKNDLPNTFIGTRDKSSHNFVGKIYAIRIYNRLLTEQEILANQDIDLKRFTPSTP